MGSLAVDPAGLGSPFHTPTTTRFYSTQTPASGSGSGSGPIPAAVVAADSHSPTASTSVVRRLFRTPLVPSVLLNTPHHGRKTSLSKSLSAKELQFEPSSEVSEADAEDADDTTMATFTDLPVEVSLVVGGS